MNDHLPLQEEILLLSLRDQEGTVVSGTMYQQAIAGALLAELMLRGRVSVDESGRKKLAQVTDNKPTGNPLLDECMHMIGGTSKPKTLAHWVGKFAAIKQLKHRVAEPLCDRGILREEEGTVLVIFSRRIYPETDPRPEYEIVERLRRAVFTDNRSVDPRTVVLASLANSTGVLRHVFDKKELKQRKERIEEVVNGELIGKATGDAIQAVQVALMVAAIMPAITATTH